MEKRLNIFGELNLIPGLMLFGVIKQIARQSGYGRTSVNQVIHGKSQNVIILQTLKIYFINVLESRSLTPQGKESVEKYLMDLELRIEKWKRKSKNKKPGWGLFVND